MSSQEGMGAQRSWGWRSKCGSHQGMDAFKALNLNETLGSGVGKVKEEHEDWSVFTGNKGKEEREKETWKEKPVREEQKESVETGKQRIISEKRGWPAMSVLPRGHIRWGWRIDKKISKKEMSVTLPGSFSSVLCVCVVAAGDRGDGFWGGKVRNGNRKHRPLFLGHLNKEEQENRMVISLRRAIVKGTLYSMFVFRKWWSKWGRTW